MDVVARKRAIFLWLFTFLLISSLGAMVPSPRALSAIESGLSTRQSQTTPQYDIVLINLNAHINKWYMLELQDKLGGGTRRFHLESINQQQSLRLSSRGIVLTSSDDGVAPLHCLLWASPQHHIDRLPLNGYRNPYFPLCEGRLYLRLLRSSDTKLSLTEWATEVLRKTDFGESVINIVKPMLVGLDAEASKLHYGKDETRPTPSTRRHEPLNAAIQHSTGQRPATSRQQLGISLVSKEPLLDYGAWYPVTMHPGIFVSLFVPGVMNDKLASSRHPNLYPLPPEEADKLVYLMAYDLKRYSLAYSVGTTDPPIVDGTTPWRESLVPIGSIPPYELASAIGVFIGGFKQRHATFRSGPHRGKSYGYIEAGVELAPMAPGLASIYSDRHGELSIEAWPDQAAAQTALRQKVVSARQNGVLLIDEGAVGPLVKHWRDGNWSADAHGLRRSLRAGICLQEQADERYLLFMAFTSATPSTMARVMRAYHCRMGMHLDMNAHMYLHNALYEVDQRGQFKVEYLNTEMLYPPDLKRHRFIMDNNHRDFFYVRRRNQETAVSDNGPTRKGASKKKSSDAAEQGSKRSRLSRWFGLW